MIICPVPAGGSSDELIEALTPVETGQITRFTIVLVGFVVLGSRAARGQNAQADGEDNPQNDSQPYWRTAPMAFSALRDVPGPSSRRIAAIPPYRPKNHFGITGSGITPQPPASARRVPIIRR
jgi:hypothetical protein